MSPKGGTSATTINILSIQDGGCHFVVKVKKCRISDCIVIKFLRYHNVAKMKKLYNDDDESFSAHSALSAAPYKFHHF